MYNGVFFGGSIRIIVRHSKSLSRLTKYLSFPMKKRMLGTRIERYVEVRVGKETATDERLVPELIAPTGRRAHRIERL